MDADDLYNQLHEFVNTLKDSGREIADSVRERALEVASDAQDLATASYKTLNERYYQFNAYVGQVSNEIHDALSENDLYVIMNTLLQALAAMARGAALDGSDGASP